ncbi:MAG: hypothetical protein RL266_1104 [Bacteroidota bacterium]|jgi:peroxiredoxin
MRQLLYLFVLFTLGASAQTASDFTITDVDGNSRNLFTELDNENIVVLKFFTNWCSICNNTADEVVAIYNGYQAASEPVVFWALDRDQNETNADAITYRNNNSIPFPVIGEAYPVAQQFGVVYQPEYYIIRPDRSYVKRTNYTAMETAVNEALEALNSLGVEDDLKPAGLRISDRSITWLRSVNETAELHVFDASGRMVLDRRINGQETVELDLSSGVYIYRLLANGSTFTGKIGLAQ